MRLFRIAVLALPLLLATSMAWAQECPSSTTPDQDRQAARDTYDAGVELAEAGDFAEALGRFQCSLSLFDHHDTVYNIAQCQEEIGDLAGALASLRLYLEMNSDGPDTPEIQGAIERIEEQLREQPAEEPAEPRDPQPDPNWPAPEPPFDTRMSSARGWAWGTLGLGLALGGIGAGLLGAGASEWNNFERRRDEGITCVASLRDSADRGRTLDTVGWAMLGVGIASFTASIVLFVAFDAQVRVQQDQMAFVPFFGDSSGLSLTGVF